ncbi:heterodisulfide reductase, subunit A [Vulcanisaeta moutnovskia 768-28]|uniref:CoB--CoM heterodisulfide reductase iron-sulfur subunit A n=1 Tax=Vulcanisaeta moutnovskia (strain 768-28) TaxID=985053 RepID=F0QY47_VULM7|nr:CoB--CoM heterodisulfide reductase iron-sulfur subunit A family protein [Vulcanisaeta moutnovskia]ADY02533.1 heterodisulfide reductase, subunit A [Vulcanisaeta moutnovskia 768-28]
MERSDKIRIGVYVCHCGGNISDVVNVKRVVDEVRKEKGVVVAKDFMFMCSEAGQKLIENDIRSGKVNAVVVASCSPRLHEATFRAAIARAGGNSYMYYHVDVREECSWVHENDKEEATNKAIRQVRAAIAYLRHAEPLSRIRVNCERSVLVIGGGIAGLRTALDLAESGLTVYLVERTPFLGGNAAKIGNVKVFPYEKTAIDVVRELIERLRKMSNVAIYTNAEVENVSGYVGNFDVTIKVNPRYFRGKPNGREVEELRKICPRKARDEFSYEVSERTAIMFPPFNGTYPEIPAIDMALCDKCGLCTKMSDKIDLSQEPQIVHLKVGAIVVATGFKPYKPEKSEYGYGLPGVITLQELVGIINRYGDVVINGRRPRSIAFIYCVGSRQRRVDGKKANEYCSRYCCIAALDVAAAIKEFLKDVKIYHVVRDVRSYGINELLFEEASKQGQVIIKYDVDEGEPQVTYINGKPIVKVKDVLTEHMELELPVDLVVLVTGMEPSDGTVNIAEKLKISRGTDGFLQEVHPKLRPVETMLSGIFIAGTAQAPRGVGETLASASAAAAKVMSLVLKGYTELEPFVAFVDQDSCRGSGLCVSECPYGAIVIKEYAGSKKAWVNEVLCKGCGACVAVCPSGAVQLRGLRNVQIEDMIRAAGGAHD